MSNYKQWKFCIKFLYTYFVSLQFINIFWLYMYPCAHDQHKTRKQCNRRIFSGRGGFPTFILRHNLSKLHFWRRHSSNYLSHEYVVRPHSFTTLKKFHRNESCPYQNVRMTSEYTHFFYKKAVYKELSSQFTKLPIPYSYKFSRVLIFAYSGCAKFENFRTGLFSRTPTQRI